eukprot:TRINITY_DN21523_c0_g1_i1.p1 TRINITY_DN21523_c0_g1~~TRINITY_DN21523_c0_g1_i1.p1  ORF type:complete len:879 (+),score=87.95 TRINITY_DN21523_c0_g1_i1:42-2678(+)
MSCDYEGGEHEVNSDGFEAPLWARAAMTKRPLEDLTKTRTFLQAETEELDSRLQKMVYSNYSNYAAGTKLIGGLKDKVAHMTNGLEELQDLIETNQGYLSKAIGNTIEGGQAVDHLVAITATLAGVRLLLELPTRLKRCVAANDLAGGVRLWVRGRDALMRQTNKASLSFIREQCEPIVDGICARLWQNIETCEEIRADVWALQLFGQPVDEINFEIKARLSGQIAKRLDTEVNITDLSSATSVLVTCMIEAELHQKEVVKAAAEVISPKLAEMATAACTMALHTGHPHELFNCASTIASQLSEIVQVIGCHLPPEAVGSFVQKTIREHLSNSLVADMFLNCENKNLARFASDALSRGVIAYYLSLPSCLQDAGLNVECDAAQIAELSKGLLLRHAHLASQSITCTVIELMCPDTDESPTTVGLLGYTLISTLNATATRITDSTIVNSSTCEALQKPHTEDLARSIVDSAMRTLLETIRKITINSEESFLQTLIDIEYIRRGLVAFGVGGAEVSAWRDDMCSAAESRCVVEVDVSMENINAIVDAYVVPSEEAGPVVNEAKTAAINDVPTAWEKGELLGRGTFSSVYKGTWPDGSVIAVKVIPLTSVQEQVTDIVLQVQELSTLVHNNVVRLYGCAYSKESNELHMFTEYIKGSTLGAIVRRSPSRLSEALAVKHLKQFASGLAHLHSRGFVHSDVKGDTILVDSHSIVKIVDFGASKKVQNKEKDTKGAPLWMAPEVIRGEAASCASDVWSLGILACEVLACGAVPWPSFASVSQALDTIGHWSEPLPPHVPSGLSREAMHFLRCCLCPLKEARWPVHSLLHHPWISATGEVHQAPTDFVHMYSNRAFALKSQDLQTLFAPSAPPLQAAQLAYLFPV